MLYVRKRDEQIYTPLHIVPPSLAGFIQAVVEKFGVESEKVMHFSLFLGVFCIFAITLSRVHPEGACALCYTSGSYK